MVKVIGAIIVILGTTSLGGYLSFVYKNRLNNLYEIRKAFLYIQGEIHYMNTPMPELLEMVSLRIKGPFRFFFQTVAGESGIRSAGGLKEIWRESYHKEISWKLLEKEAEDEFMEIGGQLGVLDRTTQEKAIDYFLQKWEWIIEKRQRDQSSKIRLYYVCGVAGGILVVLLLV